MQNYQFKLALSPREIKAYFQLRKAIFCEEQGFFEQSDHDEYDSISYPIIAVNEDDQVVGVVRIYEVETGFWYGGRLGVHQDYRRVGIIGKGLINKAVTTANSWGCHRFLATVSATKCTLFPTLTLAFSPRNYY